MRRVSYRLLFRVMNEVHFAIVSMNDSGMDIPVHSSCTRRSRIGPHAIKFYRPFVVSFEKSHA